MKTKPVCATAGALLTGVLLSGCGFGRMFHDGGQSSPAPAPASLSYSQVPGWTAQPARPAASGYQPVAMPSSSTAKADSGAMEVATSLQLVNGTAGSTYPTPMLTITLPAVKFLVPVTGSYSFGAPPGDTAVSPITSGSDAQSTHSNTTMPNSGSATTPTIQYLVPTTPGIQPTVRYAPAPAAAASPQHLPPFTPPDTSAAPAAAPKMEETPTATSAPAPAPNWPAEGPAADSASPPPPPPINRQPQGPPMGQ